MREYKTILDTVCDKCHKSETFTGSMKRDVHASAKRAGWRIINTEDACAKCFKEYMATMYQPNRQRNRDMVNSRVAGKTFKAIGLQWGISTERVRQIVSKTRRLEERRAS
jgi:hypothetical protein